MDPRLLRYYSRELQHLREMGGEFAKQFPKVAGRLGLETFECADPYVERLLEGFAFLAARVQLKLDAEFPRFTQHLLQMVYPHYLSPTPSMAVVQMQPNLAEGGLASGFVVPRGTVLRSILGKGDQTACEYRTAHDVTLWPIEVVKAEYGSFLGDLADLRLPPRAKAALRLRLRTTAGLSWDALSLERLPLYLRGGDEVAMRLYEQLLGHVVAMVARPAGRPGDRGDVITGKVTAPVGFEDNEALLPYGPRSFQGYRLLHEYFAFPARYMFVEVSGLGPAVRRCNQAEIEIVILFDTQVPALERAVSESQVALHCTPAINLFSRRADRIHLTEAEHEYHVVPDRTRPMDFEVYSVGEVIGFGTSTDQREEFLPFYAANDQLGRDERAAYYTITRQPRVLSPRQKAGGARSSYVGSEVFLSLVDGDQGPYRPDLKQLAIETMCTNRDLPLHMTLGQGRTDFTLESGAPVESVRCVAGPTSPQPSAAHGDVAWRLISHLSLNYLSLVDSDDGQGAAALRELLSLYADLAEPATRKQIDGLKSVASQSVVRRLPAAGPISFGRGIEVTVTCDEAAFEGSGVYLLGSVMDRFFAKYVSINGFTETVLRSLQRSEIMRWPVRTGTRPVL